MPARNNATRTKCGRRGPWRTTAFGAGLRSTGLVALVVPDSATTGEAFLACAGQVPAPALSPDNVVVLDNLAPSRVAGVREAIASVGAGILVLPPCPADPNPIGQTFARLRALLHQAAART